MGLRIKKADGRKVGNAMVWAVKAGEFWYGLVLYGDGSQGNTLPQATERDAWVKAGELAFAEGYEAWLEQTCGW